MFPLFSNINLAILIRSRLRLSCYGLFGICIPVILLIIFGSAIGASIANNPTWLEGYRLYSAGGILEAILAPAGRFGKFVLVILSFSVVMGACSRELYTVANDFQVLIPKAHKALRFVWVIITSGIILGVAIGAVESFYASLVDLMYFIGYSSSSYVAIVMLEWGYFRKADPASYNHAIWDNAKKLPLGIAATIAFILPWALVDTFVANHTFLILKEANFFCSAMYG
jgi:purine-cytosine permease-like protein